MLSSAIGTLLGAALLPLGTPAALAGPATTPCGPPPDTVPPRVVSVTLPQKPLDVLQGAKGFTVKSHVVDTSEHGDPSGVATVKLVLGTSRWLFRPAMHLIAGTTSDGVWAGHVKLNRQVPRGHYRILHFLVSDVAGNAGGLPSWGEQATGQYDRVTIRGNLKAPAPKPIQPGRVLDVSLVPQHVDALNHDRKIAIGVRFANPQPTGLGVEVAGRFQRFLTLTLSHDGAWHGGFRPSRWKGPKQVAPVALWLYNNLGNLHVIKPAQLAARGLQHRLFINGGTDNVPPTISDVSISPTSVDTTSQPQTIQVSATITDAGTGPYTASGVHYVAFLVSGPGNRLSWQKLQAIDDAGHYAGSYVIPTCMQTGNYNALLEVGDRAGNFVPPSSNGAGSQTIHITSQPGDATWPYVTGGTANSQDGTVHVSFSEPVKDVTTSNLFVIKLDAALPITQVDCEATDSLPIACDGSQGGVYSAVLHTNGFAAGDSLEVLGNQNSVSPQITDLAGNPVNWECDAYQDSEGDPCPDAPISNS